MAQESTGIVTLKRGANGSTFELGADNEIMRKQLALPANERAIAWRDVEYANAADAEAGKPTPAQHSQPSGAGAPGADGGNTPRSISGLNKAGLIEVYTTELGSAPADGLTNAELADAIEKGRTTSQQQ